MGGISGTPLDCNKAWSSDLFSILENDSWAMIEVDDRCLLQTENAV
jgi:hypothetical protein